jgi:hypothetical protein
MRVSLFIIMTSLISSCGTYHPPEALSDKMSRYKPSKINPNPVPTLALWESRLGSIKKLRAKKKPVSHYQKLSNKKLYFSALYHQYNELRSYLPEQDKTPILSHCPRHHNTYLKIKTDTVQQKKLNMAKRYSSITVDTKYPELTLPLGKQTLKDKIVGTATLTQKKRYVESAISDHVKRVHAELVEVCDSGSSENYFNFENVVTHAERHRRDFQQDKKKSMSSLLRTTLFYNKALLRGLNSAAYRGRFPASTNNKEEDASFSAVADKLDTSWSFDYFDAL